MPIRLADLRKETRKIEVMLGGEMLTVEYRVNVVTPAFIDDAPGVVEQLQAALVGWDLLGDEGSEPLEITIETLRVIPVSALRKIMDAIMADMLGPGGDEKKE